MVQQIATVKTESAVSSLPFDFSANAFSSSDLSRQTFNNELMKQSQLLEVYQQPRERVSNTQSIGAGQNTNNTRQSSYENNAGYHNNEPRNTEQSSSANKQEAQESAFESAKHRDNENINKTQESKDKHQQNHQAVKDNHAQNEKNESTLSKLDENSANISIDRSPKESTEFKAEESIQTEHPKNATDEKDIKVSIQSRAETKKDDAELGVSSDNDSVSEQYIKDQVRDKHFDYISHVSEVADFTNDPQQAQNNKLEKLVSVGEKNDEIDTSNIDSSDQSELSLIFSNLSSLLSDAGQNGTNEDARVTDDVGINKSLLKLEEEFTNISLSKEELQFILDAKQADIDLDSELLPEVLAKLDSIIKDMLSQLSAGDSVVADSSEAEIAALAAANESLLKSLLQLSDSQNSNKATKASEASANKDNLVSHLTQLSKDSAPPVQAENINLQNSVTELTSLESADSQIKQDVLAQIVKSELEQSALIETSKKKAVSLALSDAPQKQSEVSDKSALQNLAKLNEQQSQKALENISQRIQVIASEISEPGKANEFIAALQSSLQEFKQQLASGREPGIDLNSMVNDALSQISSETSLNPSKASKVEASLGQFNAILNLANTVNYSATQQQAQVLGITDLQLAKEINHQQIEGTKLANVTNSQLSAQANADKAVNIFKQEGQNQLAEKVRWMVNSRNTSAEIRLDPPDLGGINIKVNLSGDTAQVNFNVQSNAAKDALDQAAPRLREMLNEQGIELGQSFVQQDKQQRDNQQDGEQFAGSAEQSGIPDTDVEDALEDSVNVVEQKITNGALGGIDYYA